MRNNEKYINAGGHAILLFLYHPSPPGPLAIAHEVVATLRESSSKMQLEGIYAVVTLPVVRRLGASEEAVRAILAPN